MATGFVYEAQHIRRVQRVRVVRGRSEAMQSNQDVRKTKSWGGWPLAAAAIGAFLVAGTMATPAEADSNFEHGFEDQLGRIFAFEAVNLGKHVLFQSAAHTSWDNHRDRHHGGYNRHHRYVRYEGHNGHGKHYWKSPRRHHAPKNNHWRKHDHGREYYRDRHHGDRRREHRHDRSCRSSHTY